MILEKSFDWESFDWESFNWESFNVESFNVESFNVESFDVISGGDSTVGSSVNGLLQLLTFLLCVCVFWIMQGQWTRGIVFWMLEIVL